VWFALLVLASVSVNACSGGPVRLTPELQQRFDTEGIVRRADKVFFRYSHDLGTPRSGWEEWPATLIVTHRTIFIHDGVRIRLEITPRSTGEYRVRREGGRVSVRAGSGRSGRSWAFHPPDDPERWVKDLRAVIEASAGARRRR